MISKRLVQALGNSLRRAAEGYFLPGCKDDLDTEAPSLVLGFLSLSLIFTTVKPSHRAHTVEAVRQLFCQIRNTISSTSTGGKQ